MLRRHVLGMIVLAGLAPGLAGTIASCSSKSAAALSDGCAINSDCDSPLICAFARCHNQCAASSDCPMGERCVQSGTLGVCQLPAESTCTGTTACQGGEVCGTDQQCRARCVTTASCTAGDFCLPSGSSDACYATSNGADEPALVAAGILSADGALLADGATGGIGPDGSGGGPDAGSRDAVSESNSCPSAQTQFGNTAQGDSNPNFTSGVGVRTADKLLIFSGYAGPDPDAGAATDAGDAGTVNLVYVQAFNPTTANKLGAAAPLFSAPGDAPNIWLETASVAPTGEIVVIYSFYATSGATSSVCYYGFYNYAVPTYTIGDCQNGLYAAFLSPSADAGTGLQVQQIVQLASSVTYGQAHAVWSPTKEAFVISWEYYTSPDWFLGVKNFLPNGQAAGGDTAVVPTNTPSGAPDQGDVEQGSVASFGGLLAVAFQDSTRGYPWLSILDSNGNQVGGSVQVASVAGSWVTVGATSQGVVYFYDDVTGVDEVWVPTSADAGATAGIPDGGDASSYAGFPFPGAIRAIDGRAVNDDTGGAGGVGVALFYADGLSFAYVNADGVSHSAASSVIAHTYAAGDQANISNFGGSFAVSVYGSATHSTQLAVSGCH